MHYKLLVELLEYSQLVLLGLTDLQVYFRRGDNSYFNIPLINLEPKNRAAWNDEVPVEVLATGRK